MTKTTKITIGIILFIIILSASFLVFKYNAGETEKQNPKICCNEHCFNLEIADDPESRQLGLMHRESLADENGMLFIFDKMGTYSFWMKNTLIPLAGIRINSDLKIIDIIQMDPCKIEECPSYTPQSEAQYVLEINQGLISEKGLLHTGDLCKLIIN